MFRRRQTEKRTRQVAVRVTQEEYEALEWCGKMLAQQQGGAFVASDVLREALAILYEQLQAEVAKKKKPR